MLRKIITSGACSEGGHQSQNPAVNLLNQLINSKIQRGLGVLGKSITNRSRKPFLKE